METINKNILLIELDDKYLKITAGFQDDEFNFKIIATEVISTNNFENGQIKDLERSVIELKSGLVIIEKKLTTIYLEQIFQFSMKRNYIKISRTMFLFFLGILQMK